MQGPNDLTSSLVAQKEIIYNRYPGKAVLAFLSKKIIPVPWSKKVREIIDSLVLNPFARRAGQFMFRAKNAWKPSKYCNLFLKNHWQRLYFFPKLFKSLFQYLAT